MNKNNETHKKNKTNKKDFVIKIVLIIIILLLLLHNCSLIQKNSNNLEQTSTGNVDIFEIQCEQDYCETDSEKEDTLPVDSNSSNSNTISGNTVSSSSNTTNGDMEVLDRNITWSSTNTLRIFSNSIYTIDSIIAPESTNTYQFIVRNNTKYNISYQLTFIENNPYSINMKYKLKLDDEYLAGDKNTWVSYEELSMTSISLIKSKEHTYSLEWKWVSSDNDTSIGSAVDANYQLNISIKAEQNNE